MKFLGEDDSGGTPHRKKRCDPLLPATMTFQTSAESYHWLVNHGVLNRLRRDVYATMVDYVEQHGDKSFNQQMIFRLMRQKNPRLLKDTTSPRFKELERMQVIAPDHKGECPVTGHNTVFFVLTNRYVRPPPEVVQPTVKSLQAELDKLVSKFGLMPGARRDWVDCPVCGEPDMLWEEDAEGNVLIHCVNHACVSNGGTNRSAIK